MLVIDNVGLLPLVNVSAVACHLANIGVVVIRQGAVRIGWCVQSQNGHLRYLVACTFSADMLVFERGLLMNCLFSSFPFPLSCTDAVSGDWIQV